MRRLKVAAAFAACLGFVLAAEAREQKKRPYPHKILAEIATGKVPSALASVRLALPCEDCAVGSGRVPKGGFAL